MAAGLGRREYRREASLVTHFARCLRSGTTPWGKVRVRFEFDYVGGWSDLVALCPHGNVLAFEAKLERWRDALHQAYRTRCFANRSYVVLPAETARIAARYEDEFRRRRVGLCAVSADRGVEMLLDTGPAVPLQPWIAARALAQLSRGGPGRHAR